MKYRALSEIFNLHLSVMRVDSQRIRSSPTQSQLVVPRIVSRALEKARQNGDVGFQGVVDANRNDVASADVLASQPESAADALILHFGERCLSPGRRVDLKLKDVSELSFEF